MLRIMWPEGEPEKAVMVSNPFRDWLNAFSWSLRGRRTCRISTWVDKDSDPVKEARLGEVLMAEFF